MAIYSVQVKSLSRGKGDSATAAAAYRAGLDLDDPSGARHSYSRKTGVLSVDMLAPTNAPAWALDPHQLWSKVEEHETRKNARVAREVLMALPHELTPEQRRALAREVGQLLVERYSVAVQIALHAPDKGGDERNYHAQPYHGAGGVTGGAQRNPGSPVRAWTDHHQRAPVLMRGDTGRGMAWQLAPAK
ncbi:MobA/MobL family protein [Stenotrophomonas maltophilia]|nr:MobA/MobL family protein [Stenotrophomonas maltophilia]